MSQQYEIMKDVMNQIHKAFNTVGYIPPIDERFTLVETASCETYNGYMDEEISIRFDLVGEFGGYYWQHTEFGREPQCGDVFETALEAYNDAIAYIEKLAERRSDIMQSEYTHYRLGGGRP